MISFQNITKKFGPSITALEDVNLEIRNGEFVFLVGPSGAGKSTLLKLLTGEYQPTSGKIIFDEIDVTKLKPKDLPKFRRKIGFVFQDCKLLENKTVFENISLTLEVRGIKPEEISKEVERTLKLFDIWERHSLFPKQLSGGEAQRVALARAVIGKPEVLLADEPTGDLDPQTAWSVLQLLSEVNSWGTTVIMATHNREIVDLQKRRVVSLKNGKITKDINEGKYEYH